MINKSILTFGTELDIKFINKIIDNIGKDSFYKIENKKISFLNIYSDNNVELNCYFDKVEYNDDFKKILSHYLFQAIDKYEKKDELNLFKKNINTFVEKFYINNIKEKSLFMVLTNLFFELLDLELISNNKQISIYVLSSILMFFGFYIKYNSVYKNAGIYYWVEYLEILKTNSKDLQTRETFFNNLLNHINFIILCPTFYDEQNTFLNHINHQNKNQIFIQYEYRNENKDYHYVESLYLESYKKINIETYNLIEALNND